MPLSYTKNIITYNQNEAPTNNLIEGELWYNPLNNSVYKWIKNVTYPSGHWINYDSKFYTGADFGYNMGGSNASAILSTIDRIMFPFDSGTALNIGNLSTSRAPSAPVGYNSSSYGYCAGGLNASTNVISMIDRITFPFNSGTSINTGTISGARYHIGGCNSSMHGYIIGGHNLGSGITAIDRFTFPFDSGVSSQPMFQSGSRYASAGCNSSNYGYAMGGSNGNDHVSIVDRIIFPYDTGTATHIANLSSSKIYASGCNSSNYGYCMGSTIIVAIDRLSFPFAGNMTYIGNLSGVKYSGASCNSSNYGYSMGGAASSSVFLSTIDRIAFPFDSGTASNVGNLTGSRYLASGVDGTDFCTLFN
jgi:hypothetical protein